MMLLLNCLDLHHQIVFLGDEQFNSSNISAESNAISLCDKISRIFGEKVIL